MTLFDFSAPRGEEPSDDSDLRRLFCFVGVFFDDDRLEYHQRPRGGDFLHIFILSRFLGLLLHRIHRCFGGSALIVSLYFGHLPCESSRDSALYAKSSNDACWCSAHQYRRVFQIGWVAPSSNRALRAFSSCTDPQLSVLVYSC